MPERVLPGELPAATPTQAPVRECRARQQHDGSTTDALRHHHVGGAPRSWLSCAHRVGVVPGHLSHYTTGARQTHYGRCAAVVFPSC